MLRFRAGSLVTSLVLAPACAASSQPAATAAVPTVSSTSPAPARVGHDGLSFELPGTWPEEATKDGYEWRKGNVEVITAFMPWKGAASVETLASAQREAVAQLCKRGLRAAEPTRVTTAGLPWIRTTITCQEPPVVAVLGATSAHGRVLSFEQYLNAETTMTTEKGASTTAVLDSVRIEAVAVSCPGDLLTSASRDGGACLEAAVLGDAVVNACVREVEAHHWTRDDWASQSIGKQTGKTLICYRAPPN